MNIDGNSIAGKIFYDIAAEVREFIKKGLPPPHLAVILVGNNPASETYVNIKKKRATECGIDFTLLHLQEDTPQEELIAKIRETSNNPAVDGLIVQVPLPKGLDEKKALQEISPDKDVDGLHPLNIGRLVQNEDSLLPCTPAGIIELIRSTGRDLNGLNTVVVGRSNIVGKPVSLLLLKENCTVTICHSRTKDLPGIIKKADLLVAAIGRPEFIKGDWIKEGAIVIDVGTNRIEDKSREKGYRQVGDVEYRTASGRASYITPSPGGVGPMTVAMLLKNTLKVYKEHRAL
ncbi:MAG: bifunctional methylenetetrahydrofolate dehydrogenase/methenyltetrahydrofolate cyclohydrolase FolD [bacterium]|nr:bifunctional methylenetetrahydrofolate dehydrogenase/methenyltetrahydrofolate cyclohydrolase FolD [bacterium]